MSQKPPLDKRPGAGPDDDPLPPDPVIEVYKLDVDLSLLRENLKLTPTERLLKLQALQEWAEELRRAGRAARGD